MNYSQTMKMQYIAIIAGALMLPLNAQDNPSAAPTAPAVPPAEADAPKAPAEATTPQIGECVKLLKQAAAALDALKSAADVDKTAEAVSAGFDALDKLVAKDAPKPTEADAQAVRDALTAVAEAWRKCGERCDDPDIVCATALVYQFYIRYTPITETMLEEDKMMGAELSIPLDREPSPELKREQQAWLASLQAKHDAVDKTVYGGGRGASDEDAITLIPFLGKDADDEATDKAVHDYLRAVVGKEVDACFMGVEAHLDGKFFKICMLYRGTFRDSDGNVQLRVLPLYFRVR